MKRAPDHLVSSVGNGVLKAGSALALIVLTYLLPTPATAAQLGAKTLDWLLVDTQNLTLSVMRGKRPELTLHNLAIGRYGTSAEKRQGDNTTPLGRFRVTGIDRKSGFHRFIALDYPDDERAKKAHAAGEISRQQLQAIASAHRRGKAPRQDTRLGGRIGIHGLGDGDPVLHETMNWTRGCVALTDRQVDTLLLWVRIGMTVEIR